MDMDTKWQECLRKKQQASNNHIPALHANTKKDKTVCTETKLLTCGAG